MIEPTTSELIASVYDWQTLIAGVFAAIAAFATIAGIRDQIDADRNRTRDERARRAGSYRAVLPLVLSTLCDLLERDISALKAAIDAGQASRSFSMPPFDPLGSLGSEIETIRSTIEYEDNDTTALRDLQILLARLQIYRARRRPPQPGTIFGRRELQRLAIDGIDLYAIAAGLFDYGRPADLRVYDVGLDRMMSAAHNVHLWDGDSDGIADAIRERYR
jgi:hypothetical protein